MKWRYFNRSLCRLNIIFHCINFFEEINLKLFDRIITRTRRYYYRYPICLICIFLIFSIIISIKLFSTTKYSDPLEIYSVYRSTSFLTDRDIILNIYNQSIHHIYIDIGCYNGETIEHFIHFNPDSLIYDIITFEPDPVNYHLCKHRLTQSKYRNYNIIIIPKVVWIRNEKVFYQINFGQTSRIDLSETSKSFF
jgi:hypothetical protein